MKKRPTSQQTRKLMFPGFFSLFFPPSVVTAIVGLLWMTGVDPIVLSQEDHENNIRKYVQAQQRIIDNYYNVADINDLHEQSMRGFVEAMADTTITEATLPGTPLDTTFVEQPTVDDLRGSYERFKSAYEYVLNAYPEENLTDLTEQSVIKMMNTLDPHSTYIEPKDNERIQEQFAGKFQGIGIQFNIISDTITVVTAISGGPSDRLGIRSGDRIIEIEDSSAVGFNNEDVVARLRGEKGSTVHVKVLRPGTGELDFDIIRDDIPLITVDTHYMLDDQTGYVKINRFAATTHEEFMTSVQDLESEGMERLILDLRGNPGGYMSQAIAIAEEFFPSGVELVATKSRHRRFTSSYDSQRDGELKDTPLIVLVNEGSASASEIVSGAVQDHDRGLIVGKRSFGKGLVQQQYELADKSNIRVTISRYYTPSGRLIQKPFKDGREEYVQEIIAREDDASVDAIDFIETVPDSLKYSTTAGRTVYGGGGIVPDILVKDDTLSGYMFNLMVGNQVDFNFVRSYLDANNDKFRMSWERDFESFRESFAFTDDEKETFYALMKEKGLVVDESVSTPDVSGDSLIVPPSYVDQTDWMVMGRLKAELARQVWGSPYFYPVINDVFGDEIKQAMKQWESVKALEMLASEARAEDAKALR